MRTFTLAPLARHALVLALACAAAAHAAPPAGYRYVGSRLVSEGRVIYWYWYVDHVETAPDGSAFVARMFARAPDVDRERFYIATIRCDQRAYREFGSRGAFESIDEGEPIDAVWRAGCRDGRAVSLAERNARLTGATFAPEPPALRTAPAITSSSPTPGAVAPPAPTVPPKPPVAASPPARVENADPRRADACVRFTETKSTPAGDATITNTCPFPVEVTLCYKGGGGGNFDCATSPRGTHADSLAPGATHVLPEYRRGRNKGVIAIACRGTLGTVFPRLDDAIGKSGCQ
jgi:hypothetical protein